MKHLYLFCFLLSTWSISANDIKIGTGFIIHNDQRAQTIDVQFTHPDLGIQQAFTLWMAATYDYRLDGGKIIEFNRNTYSAIGCVVPQISDQLLDLHLLVEKNGDRYHLRFYASYGFDSFITRERNPLAFRHLYAKFRNFVNEYINYYPQDISDSGVF
ncbi:MAG: hypothetical protein HKN68_01460 [Saprospiraceae bacterium]|nr:hypothetical protein [Saprospiraceae bacterium]